MRSSRSWNATRSRSSPRRSGGTCTEARSPPPPAEDDSLEAYFAAAVECIFHFPSRKQFFREVSRVLAPGGTLALSDFVVREGALLELADWMTSNTLSASHFYGHSSAIAPTPSGYGRIARGQRFDVVADVDITESTLPTYAAMRRLYREAGVADGVRATDYLEALARQRLVEYRLLAFSPRWPR